VTVQLALRLARLAGFAARLNGARPAPLRTRAQGVVDPHNPGNRRLVVTVDEATFAGVRRAAAAADISVSEAIRQLLTRGLAARGDA
jgi:hypothetical protein